MLSPPPHSNSFLKQWGSLVIATIALIQPWLITLWRKYFRQGIADVYETLRIEIGFNQYGPIIALHGTLTASNRDLFIKNISLHITKHSNSARYLFNWLFFGPYKIFLNPLPQDPLELPAGFMLNTQAPKRYYIWFSDQNNSQELGELILKLKKNWNEFLSSKIPNQHSIAGNFTSQGILSWIPTSAYSPPNYDQFFQEFLQSNDLALEFYRTYDRLLYWEAGKYDLEMKVETSKPTKAFIKQWKFEISPSDFNALKSNANQILKLILGISQAPISFIFSNYEEFSSKL